MNAPLFSSAALMIVVALFCASSAAADAASSSAPKESMRIFTIHPNQKDRVEIPLDTPPNADSTCVFSFSTYGATPEQWVGIVRADLDTRELTCEVERDNGQTTYLLFEQFSLALGSLEAKSAAVHDNDGALQEGSQYVRKGGLVLNAPGWSGSMRRVDISCEQVL